MDCRKIPITSPAGNWRKDELIGGVVKFTSLPWDFFGIDANQHYKIDDIKYMVDQTGRMKCSIHLEGIKRASSWKDLELVSLRMTPKKDPICGLFCCAEAKCSYGEEETCERCTYDGEGPVLD